MRAIRDTALSLRLKAKGFAPAIFVQCEKVPLDRSVLRTTQATPRGEYSRQKCVSAHIPKHYRYSSLRTVGKVDIGGRDSDLIPPYLLIYELSFGGSWPFLDSG